MRSEEVAALGRASGSALARIGGVPGGVHRAVAGRTFGMLGVVGTPVRLAHDGISALAYGAVGRAMQAVPSAGAAALARAVPVHARPLADTPAGSLALAALNGMYGDRVASHLPDLALELTVRRRGRAIEPDSAGLARAYPEATDKLAVFVHGLCETEHAWNPSRAGRSYGARLREELGYTPVYVRYNTGLHVSDNGRRLAEVLDHLVAAWPRDVEEIVLVGHSMGGLVARSACHYGEADERAWVHPVRHVFCLGTPHLGAPLERLANRAGWRLGRLPETRPFAELINARSAGIKDLRFGSCVEADWCDCDPDDFLDDRCTEVPFLPAATYYFIGATLARERDNRFGKIVGDLLVQYVSASGDGPARRIPFEADNGCHVGGVNHFQLLNHPAVYEQLRGWLERAPATGLPALSSGTPS